jgi:uncharacterized protein involved in exopolysaccharide biosynthesis
MELNSDSNDITLKDFLLKLKSIYFFLFSRWKVILLFGMLGGMAGLWYSYSKKPIYTATLNFVLEDEKSSLGGLSGAMGLATSFGVDLGSSTGGMFSGSNLIALMKTRKIIENVLLKPIKVDGKTRTFAQYFIEFNSKDNRAKKVIFDTYTSRSDFTRQQDSTLYDMYMNILNMLTIKQNDIKTSIISVEFKASSEIFCKEFVENLSQEVSDYYIEIKSKKSRQNMEILQRQTDSIRAVLNGSIVSVAAAVDNAFGLNPAMQVQKTTISKKQFDVQANTTILTQLVTNLEMAKVSLRKETPLIQVIDKPILPLKKEKVGKLKSLLLGGFLAGFLTALILVFKKLFATILN